MSSNQKALKAGVWYTISNFTNRALGAILTPIMTRLLTTSEYGDFVNFSSWAGILIVITSLDMANVIIRAKFDYEDDFDGYMNSKNTWFRNKYPENKNDLIAYFSAEYGLDQTIPIYSGGLGILSGDHLKSASDLGIPLVAVGLLYKHGYFNQKINGYGAQESEYYDLDMYNLPLETVKDKNGEDLIISVKFPRRRVYLKAWKVTVGRVSLYLLDSDVDQNSPEDRLVTSTLYGGDQEMRIQQEIILGMGGTHFLHEIGLNPTIYHMNEGHSAFLTLEIIKDIIKNLI